MKKKLLVSIILLLCFIIVGCGNTNSQNKNKGENAKQGSLELKEEKNEENETVTAYFEYLTKENVEEEIEYAKENYADLDYKKYDDDYYYVELTKKQCDEELKKYSENSLKEKIEEDSEQPYIKKIEYSKNYDCIKIYVDREAYDEEPFAGVIIQVLTMEYQNLLQGYSLVPIEDRVYYYEIIDNSTKEVISTIND